MKSWTLLAVGCLLLILAGVRGADETESLNPFGVGADNETSQAWQKWMPQMASIGLTETRGLRCCWSDVEPQKGNWTWDRMDAQLDDAAAHNMDFTGIFLYNVEWNTADPLDGMPVHDLPDWAEYISETVKHIDGRARYFEVWNEPPNGTNAAPPSDYSSLVVTTYDAAKAADPNCQIGLAAQSVNVNYLEQTIQDGAKDHFDYITLHPYEVLGCIDQGNEAVYMNIVPVIRKMLAAQDPARVNVPIWFTELGTTITNPGDAVAQGQTLVKAYAMGIAQGTACLQWFECQDGDSGAMGLLDVNGTPRPAYAALSQMIRYLGPHPGYLGWILLNNRDYGFLFHGIQGVVMVTWAPPGTSDNVNFSQLVGIVDPVAGSINYGARYRLTNAPVLVLGVPGRFVTQAGKNKNLPFPWNGNYQNAKSVSVTMGKTNKEQGLHTQSGNTIDTSAMAYGSVGRSAAFPGVSTFMVDSNFLSYTTVPIQITVVVRRDPANDNAGFKLTYESTQGFKNFDWYTIPDNKQWYTVSWQINDDQFVGKWGYNFSLISDGNTFNNYVIRSVTVTRLDK